MGRALGTSILTDEGHTGRLPRRQADPTTGTPSPMKRTPVTFREFLERIAPLDTLPAPDRGRALAALAGDDAGRIEQTALALLERLVSLGVYTRAPEEQDGPDRLLRFQRVDGRETVA